VASAGLGHIDQEGAIEEVGPPRRIDDRRHQHRPGRLECGNRPIVNTQIAAS
jgi:hypothetical protein